MSQRIPHYLDFGNIIYEAMGTLKKSIGLLSMFTQYGTLVWEVTDMIKTISMRDLRPNISKVVNNIHSKFDRYIISRRGKPEVVMISVEDYESLLETIEIQSDKDLLKSLKKAEKEIAQGKGKTLEDIQKELGLV